MSLAQRVRETRDVMLARAEQATLLANAETLPSRRQIHIDAAATWLKLASRKANLDTPKPQECNSAT